MTEPDFTASDDNQPDAWEGEPGATSEQPETAEAPGAGPYQFQLTASEVAALVTERADKLSPIAFKALVAAGEAPQPALVEGRTPFWFLEEIELWIQDHHPPRETDDDAQGGDEEKPEAEPELVYGSVADWVENFLVPVYRRELSANGSRSTWCPNWWMHAEAVIRLEALWRAWEHLRLDGKTGMSVFMKDHLDHHLPVLIDTKGPFDGCTIDRGHETTMKPFPTIAPPPELFPDVRKQAESTQAPQNEGE
ncbi:MAG TPA: DUF4913 domain-containing protein [Arthrobacter sp.]